MVKRGVFVGRFQPFHLGHLKAVREILKEVDELVIVIGSSQHSHELDNPFTAGERATMIRRALEKEEALSRCWIIPVPDAQTHMVWVAQVVGYTPKFDVVYTNEPLTRRLFVEAGFDVKPVSLYKRAKYSATEIRERIFSGKNWMELVPESVSRFVVEIDGEERLKDLTKTDKISR